MIPSGNTSSQLLATIKKESLYENLLHQLLKDFELSGLVLDIDVAITPEKLLIELQYQINNLMLHNFEGYLQLLYRVDVSEKLMQHEEIKSAEKLSEKAVYMILKREWQKVYFKNKFS